MNALTVTTVAERLDASKETARRLIKTGALQAFRLSGARGPWRVTEEDLAAYIERQKAARTDPWKRTRPRRNRSTAA